jgi:YgiT-type zinc finger domain-containing protein
MSTLRKCVSCGGTNLVTRKVTRSFGSSLDDLVIVHGIPTVVCRDCGENYVRGPVLKRLTAISQNRAKLRKVKLPVTHV